jgi:NDP-hexose 4-ketoreductase
VTARAAVRLLAEAAGYGGEVREEGPSRGRSAAVGWILADIGRAAQDLGWHPAYQLADSVKAIWAETIQR